MGNMPDKRIALVTGANQGIGLQIAKDMAAQGFTVLVGATGLSCMDVSFVRRWVANAALLR